MIDGAVIGVFSSVLMSMGGKERLVHDKLTEARAWMRDQRLPKEKQTVPPSFIGNDILCTPPQATHFRTRPPWVIVRSCMGH
eukprot:COSAG05_NODE_474_length_9484_cov_8.277784_10_plen_82_part_00